MADELTCMHDDGHVETWCRDGDHERDRVHVNEVDPAAPNERFEARRDLRVELAAPGSTTRMETP